MKKTIIIMLLIYMCCYNITNAENVPLNDYMNKNDFIASYNQNMKQLNFPMYINHIYLRKSKSDPYILACHPYKLSEKYLKIYTDNDEKIRFLSISLNKDTFKDNLRITATFDILVSLLSLDVPDEYVNSKSEMTKAIDKILDVYSDENIVIFNDYSHNKKYHLYKSNNNNFLTITIFSSKM